MGGMWKLENLDLGDSTTQIFITASQRGIGIRTDTAPIHGGSEYVEKVGVDLDRLSLTFTILGLDTPKHAWVAYIMGILKEREEIRLESPSEDDDLRIIDESRVIIFTPEGKATATQQNRAQIDITLSAIVRGIPTDAGGTYTITEDWISSFT